MGRVSTAILPVTAFLVATFFQSAAGAPPTAPAEGPGPSSQAVRPRLAVLDFRVEGKVDATGSSLVAAVVREEFNRSGRFDLMDREMMRERMTEKDFAASDECDQVRCLVKFGKTLDVQKIVGGQVASFGQTWVLTMRLVDVNTGREEKTLTRRHDGQMEDLLDVAREAAAEMLGEKPSASRPEPRGASRREDGPADRTLTLDCGNGVMMELVLIPAGTFTMGSPAAESGRDSDESLHQVKISKPFYIGKYEVTNAQFRRFKSDHNSGEYEGHGLNGDKQPVVKVSWEDAQAFCRWLSTRSGRDVRLPSESQWEYACRAGTQSAYSWGNDLDSAARFCNANDPITKRQFEWGWDAFPRDDGFRVSAPVGSFQPNAFGLYDMHGNVWEWCEDWYGAYPSGPSTDPKGPASGDVRVLRGGSWYDLPSLCRSANRFRFTPVDRYLSGGLRVVVVFSGTR